MLSAWTFANLPLRVVLFLWTFPFPLLAWMLRRDKLSENVWVYRWWVGGRRFACALYPDILVPYERVATNARLMRHERAHLLQIERVGGLLFLLTYGGHFLINYLFGPAGVRFRWYSAYRAIFWERHARVAAEQRSS